MGRVSAFADPEIIQLASEKFIPVTVDDWYQRRRQDAEGQFFIKVANQGPRKGQGGGTRQGIYCLTADGELLAFKNAGNSAEVTREQLNQALAKFKKLPDNRRLPGAVAIESFGKPDANYVRTPPANGLILRVHGRILDKKDGEVCKAACDFPGGDRASRDFLWLTANESKALIPKPELGYSYSLPTAVTKRIARFCLIDNTRGEPEFWKGTDVRKADFSLKVTSVTPEKIEVSLMGKALLADEEDLAVAKRGYDCSLKGRLTYDTAKAKFTRFDAVALGDHWGATTYTQKGVRPGRTLYGVAFGLPLIERPGDRVSPQAAREWNEYLRPN